MEGPGPGSGVKHLDGAAAGHLGELVSRQQLLRQTSYFVTGQSQDPHLAPPEHVDLGLVAGEGGQEESLERRLGRHPDPGSPGELDSPALGTGLTPTSVAVVVYAAEEDRVIDHLHQRVQHHSGGERREVEDTGDRPCLHQTVGQGEVLHQSAHGHRHHVLGLRHGDALPGEVDRLEE